MMTVKNFHKNKYSVAGNNYKPCVLIFYYLLHITQWKNCIKGPLLMTCIVLIKSNHANEIEAVMKTFDLM